MADKDRIRERAHQIWETEGRPHGRDREHWERAAREIDAETKAGPKGDGTTAAQTGSVSETYRESRDSPGVSGETIPAPRPRKPRSAR